MRGVGSSNAAVLNFFLSSFCFEKLSSSCQEVSWAKRRLNQPLGCFGTGQGLALFAIIRGQLRRQSRTTTTTRTLDFTCPTTFARLFSTQAIPQVQLSQWVEVRKSGMLVRRLQFLRRFQLTATLTRTFCFPQIPKARLVTGRWLVWSTRELEGQHGHHGRCDHRNHRWSVDHQRQHRIQTKIPRTGQILSQSMVSRHTSSSSTTTYGVRTNC